jgi:hypothetical protein
MIRSCSADTPGFRWPASAKIYGMAVTSPIDGFIVVQRSEAIRSRPTEHDLQQNRSAKSNDGETNRQSGGLK